MSEDVQRIVDECVARIAEHVDAVQIMVSWNEEAMTQCLKRGAGNWHARQGMAHEFIERDKAQEHANELARRIKPPPPLDGEEWKQ